MPVKCLEPFEKTSIAHQYLLNNQSISALSYEYRRSRRTIIRVLEERGITYIRRKQRNSYPEMTAAVYFPAAETAKDSLPKSIPTKTPWYRRFMDWLNTPVKLPTFN